MWRLESQPKLHYIAYLNTKYMTQWYTIITSLMSRHKGNYIHSLPSPARIAFLGTDEEDEQKPWAEKAITAHRKKHKNRKTAIFFFYKQKNRVKKWMKPQTADPKDRIIPQEVELITLPVIINGFDICYILC